ncbi:MAG: DUF4922 domain-containing protein [Bacteroidota bacterium]|nr:DUF4922 domain-containing protein [Bacteroidota bacterium]
MEFQEKLLFNNNFETKSNVDEAVHQLLLHQLENWELAKKNYTGLNSILERSFKYDGFEIKVQFNPERIRSSAAKVDQKSISERKCFLCSAHLPVEQKGLLYNNRFLILVNPFPIFSRHLTIPALQHRPQQIESDFISMLDLAESLNDYAIFYNGPKCGASAPDHFHFQAGNKGFLPIESEFKRIQSNKTNHTLKSKNGQICFINDYLRKLITIESADKVYVSDVFNSIYNKLKDFFPQEDEPLLNILAYKENEKFIIQIFPRQKHRPDQFYAEGEKQLLISPASVDFGGVFITPRKEDFDKITANDITDIFNQVSLDTNRFAELEQNMQSLKDFNNYNKKSII